MKKFWSVSDFLWVTSQWKHIFAFLAKFTWSWAPTQGYFWTHVFLETRLKSPSLQPLIGFLAYLEPKLWFKNPICDRNAKATPKVWFALSGQILTSHNSAADWARELFKPYKQRLVKSCSLEWKKLSFGFRVFGRWRHKWRMFCFMMASADQMSRFRGSKLHWIVG